MSKGEQLQRAVEWIIDNEMEERFCTLSYFDGKPRISFLTLIDMVKTLNGNSVKVTGSQVFGALNYSVDAFGFEFNCCSSSGCVGPGTYVLTDKILYRELVA